MPTIELNDTTLYYERTGQGPAMLFVHGMCGDAEVWADQARRFSDRYSCVRYDRRGHTRSLRGDATITGRVACGRRRVPHRRAGPRPLPAGGVEWWRRDRRRGRAALRRSPARCGVERAAALQPRSRGGSGGHGCLEAATRAGDGPRWITGCGGPRSFHSCALGCGRSSTRNAKTVTEVTPTSASPISDHRASTSHPRTSRR